MPEACQISKMMRHIESPGIVRTVYSGILRHIHQHSALYANDLHNTKTKSKLNKRT